MLQENTHLRKLVDENLYFANLASTPLNHSNGIKVVTFRFLHFEEIN